MAITVSVMTGGVNNHPTTSTEANGLTTDFVTTGVIGTFTNTSGVAPTTGAFSVNAQGTPDMTVAVGSGVAYVAGTPASQLAQKFRVYNSASANTTISANASGSTKYDWVYIKLDATLLNAPTLAGDTTATIVTSRSTSSSADDGTPPTYGYAIAVITVANGATSITNSVIRDVRSAADIGVIAGANTGWTTGALPAVSSVTENGNRSANITFASTVASLLTPGMRIRTSRTVAAPTFMGGAFNGTNHYFTKVTATSTLSTVTDNFTIMGWVEPTAYAIGGISGRSDGTLANGLYLQFTASGQINVGINNGGVGNSRSIATYQSLPLNKKTHVAVTWASGTVLAYIDGVSVPVQTAVTAGTAPTAAGTGGDFSIGRIGAFGQFFTGYISGVGVFNAVLSAATIRSYKNQVLSGAETNCIGAWSLNNTGVNQQAAGTNDLTATNSVGYTTRSPYTTDANGTPAGTNDWAIVTKVATTVATVQYPEGCAIPTSGGISTVDYSGVKAPFGMPVSERRWELDLYSSASDFTQNTPTAATFYNPTGLSFSVPLGDFKLFGEYVFEIRDDVGSPSGQVDFGISTSASAYSERKLQSAMYSANSGTSVFQSSPVSMGANVSNSAATTYYMIMRATAGTFTVIQFRGTMGPITVTATPAYL